MRRLRDQFTFSCSRVTPSGIANQGAGLLLRRARGKTLPGALPASARKVPARRPDIAAFALVRTGSDPAREAGGSWYSDALLVGSAPADNAQGFRCPVHRPALSLAENSGKVLPP